MNRDQVNTDIDNKVKLRSAANRISNLEDAANRKTMLDYCEQQIAASHVKSSGAVVLSATPAALPLDINFCSFATGIGYLPTTTKVGQEIIVVANSNNIVIRANVDNTAKLFTSWPTYVASVTLATNKIYKFTYMGDGTGEDVDGYWMAEDITPVVIPAIPQVPLVYMTQLYQTTTGNPNPNGGSDNLQLNPGDNSQALYRLVTWTRTAVGTFTLRITHKTASTTTDFNKIGVVFGDRVVKMEPGYSNGAAGAYSWREWTFKTYTNAGVVADDALTGTFATISLYP